MNTSHKLYWILVLFLPTFNKAIGTTKAQLIFYAITSITIIGFCIPRIFQKIKKKEFLILTLTITTILTSYLISSLLNFRYISNRDLPEIIRVLFYFIILAFPFLIPRNYSYKEFLAFNRPLILLQFFLCLTPFIGLTAIAHIYKDASFINLYRFSGTLGFAYNYAFLLIFYMPLFLHSYIKDNKKVDLLYFFLVVSMIVFTGSRSALLALFLTLSILIFQLPIKAKLYSFALILISIFSLVFLYFLNEYFKTIVDYNIGLITFILGGESDGSVSKRLREYEYMIMLITDKSIFGHGASKTFFDTLPFEKIESIYNYYLLKWGIFGLFINFITLYIVAIQLYLKNAIKNDPIIFSTILLIITIPIFGLSTTIYDTYRMPFIFFFILGITFWKVEKHES